jgi:hypothetical protein
MPSTLPIRIVRLEALVQGVVVGTLGGLAIVVMTIWLRLKGGPVVGPHLKLLGQFFIGYDVTFRGSLIGFVWGFATGFVVGYAVSTLYNLIVAWRVRRGALPR